MVACNSIWAVYSGYSSGYFEELIMSTWSNGSKVEKLLCDRLTKEGWITRRFAKARFGAQDVWGCDIIAKRLGQTLWIQVKSKKDSMPGIEKRVLKDMAELWNHTDDATEKIIWAGYNRKSKEWKIVEVLDPVGGKYERTLLQ